MSVILFDVNGTLLNTKALEPEIKRIFGHQLSAREWFTEVLQYSIALTQVGHYEDLGDIAEAVLAMDAHAYGLRLTSAHIQRVRKEMQQLPAFPDVKHALVRLRNAGYKLATLSNSSANTQQNQLKHAGLAPLFEHCFSVSQVEKCKPAVETYLFAVESLGVAASEVVMVAAHPWDLLGASRAGCQTAFVARPGKSPFRYAPKPDFEGNTLGDITDQMIALQQSTGMRISENQMGSKYADAGKPIAVMLGFIAAGVLGMQLLKASFPPEHKMIKPF